MEKIAAKVGNKEITEADVVKFIDEIGPQVAMQFQSADGIKTIIQEMVNQELLLLDAEENKMDQEEEFKTVVEHTKNNLLKNFAFQKILANVEVTQEELEKFFNENKDKYAKDTVEASHILVETEEEAKKVKEELNQGKDFAKLAEEYSTCPSKEAGGALGEFGKGMMVKEFEDAVFVLDEGQVSDVVKTQFGYHIIKLTKKNNGSNTTLKDVMQEVNSELLRQKQQAVYAEKIAELSKKYNNEIIDTDLFQK